MPDAGLDLYLSLSSVSWPLVPPPLFHPNCQHHLRELQASTHHNCLENLLQLLWLLGTIGNVLSTAQPLVGCPLCTSSRFAHSPQISPTSLIGAFTPFDGQGRGREVVGKGAGGRGTLSWASGKLLLGLSSAAAEHWGLGRSPHLSGPKRPHPEWEGCGFP